MHLSTRMLATEKLEKIRRERSESSSRQREFSRRKQKMENHYDWTQDARRGSAIVDDRGNFCKRPAAGLGELEPGRLSGAIPGPGCPEWRRADTCRQNGPGAAWRCGSCLWVVTLPRL